MTIALHERGVRAVLLDIEGTTTPVTFVYDVLFPYARSHMRAWLAANFNGAQLEETVRMLRAEREARARAGESLPAWSEVSGGDTIESVAAFCEWLMDRDVKSPGLKLLQGLVWSRGYADGSLVGEVFPDVPPAFQRLHAGGIVLAIYSSGSELAQRLIFGHTRYGDLTRFLSAFFDTGVGSKKDAASYAKIAQRLGLDSRNILFLSDIEAELVAAGESHFQVALCVRPGNAPASGATSAPEIRDFGQLLP